jgi:hypothetical protein
MVIDGAGRLFVSELLSHRISVGVPALADRAVIDQSIGRSGAPRQLGTTHGTATAWGGEIIRRPAASKAQLSSTTVRNPTFTPDVADLYVFRLWATNNNGSLAIRKVELSAVDLFTPVDITYTNRTFSVRVPTFSGKSYRLESKDTVLDTSWTPLGEVQRGDGTLLRLSDRTDKSQRFYRILEE